MWHTFKKNRRRKPVPWETSPPPARWPISSFQPLANLYTSAVINNDDRLLDDRFHAVKEKKGREGGGVLRVHPLPIDRADAEPTRSASEGRKDAFGRLSLPWRIWASDKARVSRGYRSQMVSRHTHWLQHKPFFLKKRKLITTPQSTGNQ